MGNKFGNYSPGVSFFFLEREMLLLIFKSLYTGKAASLLVCNMNVANHTSVFVPLSQV